MLNFSQLRESILSQNVTPKHLLLLVSYIAISLLVHYITYKLSGAYILGIVSFVLTFISLCSASLFIGYLFDKIQGTKKNKKNILLLSHDDELAAQLRYFLPNESIELEWVRTYDYAMNILSDKTTYIFIIDTDNKPKNTANLVELCRDHELSARRLPILAIQTETIAEKKRQLLLEGFDDCLPKPLKQQDIDDFYRRWINTEQNEAFLAAQENNSSASNNLENGLTQTTEATTQLPDNNSHPNPSATISKVVDIKQALTQSHQSHELAKDMLSMLITMIKDKQTKLTTLYEEKNWDELGELTHKIKGGCYCCGVPNLQSAVETVDNTLEQNQHQQMEQPFKTMMLEIERLIQWDEEYDIDLIFDGS